MRAKSDNFDFNLYDKDQLREQCKNPLFRAANKALCLAFERHDMEEKAINTVREYLRDNPGSSFLKVIRETGVTLELLERLVDEGRIEIDLSYSDRNAIEQMREELREMMNKDFGKVQGDLSRKKEEKLQEEEENKIKVTRMYTRE